MLCWILTWGGPESQSPSWAGAPHFPSLSGTWTALSGPRRPAASSPWRGRHCQTCPSPVVDQCQSHQWKSWWKVYSDIFMLTNGLLDCQRGEKQEPHNWTKSEQRTYFFSELEATHSLPGPANHNTVNIWIVIYRVWMASPCEEGYLWWHFCLRLDVTSPARAVGLPPCLGSETVIQRGKKTEK